MTRFYEHSFFPKWTATVVVVGGGTMAALASGLWPLIALAGAAVAAFGAAVVYDWGGLSSAMLSAYRRMGMTLPAGLLHFVGGAFAVLGGVIAVAALASAI